MVKIRRKKCADPRVKDVLDRLGKNKNDPNALLHSLTLLALFHEAPETDVLHKAVLLASDPAPSIVTSSNQNRAD